MSDFEIKNKVLIRYRGDAEVVTVPNRVIRIGWYTFADYKKLKEINLPVGLKVIGREAFRGCESLKEINLPDGLKEIKCWAFEGCTSLKKIELPDSITYIGLGVFKGCINLQEIVMTKKVFEVIEKEALDWERRFFMFLEIDENKIKVIIKEDNDNG